VYKSLLVLSLTVWGLSGQAPEKASSAFGFNVQNIDTTANPCSDFYQYACGSWLKSNPIPADQARWGRFDQLQERNRDVLREILEAASKPDAGRDATTRLIGDYYAACMDEKAVEAAGLKPLEDELGQIRGLRNKAQLAPVVARLQRGGVEAMFEFGSMQDFKDSSQVIAQFDQGGLGLPDRDYYLKQDAASAELRRKYVEHVAHIFVLAGETAVAAKADAETVMKIETALAQGSDDLVARRDPEKVYHKMSTREMEALGARFRWKEYLRESGAPEFESINVASPGFLKALNGAIQRFSLADWKTYLTWHLVGGEARLLPEAFVKESFAFYGKTLTGATELRPRWKRCTDLTDGELGEALGKRFVEQTFGAEGKARTLKMVDALEKALGQDLDRLPWMTAETRKQALVKLHAIANKIGYPDKWRDYSSVEIRRDDLLGDTQRADAFEFQRQLNKIGKPVDRLEWGMTPPTVNAYYDPSMNDINFPAGILQPPFYDNAMDDAVNFGGIGMVIGHELTHGFDDQGRQFDAQGNLRDWWTADDAKEFEKRAACIAGEYSKFEVAPGAMMNGQLTLGENTADNGGVRVSLMALLNTIGRADTAKIDGFTPEQRLFLAFGQVWCVNEREEALRLQVKTNPHAPGKQRVNGVVQNMPEFQKAFSCQAGQPMVSANACRVW
jgi:endothelin-converting enzyme/putative endopeptidase